MGRGRPGVSGLPASGALAEDLAALAYSLRLALLDALHVPRILSEIHVSPLRGGKGVNPDRSAAKQTVLAHLDKMVEAGLVKTGETARVGKSLTTYATNPQRLHALAEDLRGLVQRHGGRGAQEEHTGTVVRGARTAADAGPRVVVVHGAYEGKAYALAEPTKPAWVIGRAPGLDVSLDYDPFVSAKHATIEKHPTEWILVDAGGKNGTSVNWRELPRGGTRPLARGDIIGVGRSLLAFYEA